MRWKQVEGFECYEVSDTGLVRSIDRMSMNKTKNGKDRPCYLKGKILSPGNPKSGRDTVNLRKNGKSYSNGIHALVAKAFVDGYKKGLTVNHIDGNPSNNHYTNLEWITLKENIQHAFVHSLIDTQKKVAMLDENDNILKVFSGEASACRIMGVSQGKIGRAIRRNGTSCGYKWQFIEESATTIEKWQMPNLVE